MQYQNAIIEVTCYEAVLNCGFRFLKLICLEIPEITFVCRKINLNEFYLII